MLPSQERPVSVMPRFLPGTRSRRNPETRIAAPILLLLAILLPGIAMGQGRGTTPDEAPPSATSPTQTQTPMPGSMEQALPSLGRAPRDEQDRPVDPATYVLGPGDGLVLSVLGRVSLNTPLDVDPEGQVWIPDLGKLDVGGITLAVARERLKKMFSGGTHGLTSYLRLVRMRHFKVYVLGRVGSPGAVDVTPVTRVSEAIDRAGGFTEDSSQRNIGLTRLDGKKVSVDLLSFARGMGDAGNPYLLDGDQVFVGARQRPYYLFAPMPYSGAIESRPGDHLSDLIGLGGGFNPDADLSAAQLLHFRGDQDIDTIAIDLRHLDTGAGNVELSEGDRLFVPARGDYHQDRSVTVHGEVLRPGTYPISEGHDLVSQVIREAGGVTSLGNDRTILVVRKSGEAQDKDPEFDRLARLSRRDMTENEYQNFRTKLAAARAVHLVNLEVKDGESSPPGEHTVEGDVRLEPGDEIFVERLSFSVQLGGEVRHPGLVAFDPARTGDDYIRLAGGYSGRARRSAVRLTRAATGQTIPLRDAGRVEPGDLIFVPEKNDINLWSVIRDVLVAGGAVATTVIAFRR
jgi:protein involved in polysaccharide export with SLBB domain